ncbi:MAG TPA: hypothetical protein VF089_12690, partial [Candidatus Binatia bacterium]
MTTSFPAHRTVIYRITALFLLINFILHAQGRGLEPGSPAGSSESSANQQSQSLPVYDASPSSGVPGRAYHVNIISRT